MLFYASSLSTTPSTPKVAKLQSFPQIKCIIENAITPGGLGQEIFFLAASEK